MWETYSWVYIDWKNLFIHCELIFIWKFYHKGAMQNLYRRHIDKQLPSKYYIRPFKAWVYIYIYIFFYNLNRCPNTHSKTRKWLVFHSVTLHWILVNALALILLTLYWPNTDVLGEKGKKRKYQRVRYVLAFISWWVPLMSRPTGVWLICQSALWHCSQSITNYQSTGCSCHCPL